MCPYVLSGHTMRNLATSGCSLSVKLIYINAGRGMLQILHLLFTSVFLCVCVHVGAEGQFQVPLLRCYIPCVLRQGLLLARNLLSKLEWLASEPLVTCMSPSPLCWGLHVYTCESAWLLTWDLGLKFRPYPCTAITLPTELSLKDLVYSPGYERNTK